MFIAYLIFVVTITRHPNPNRASNDQQRDCALIGLVFISITHPNTLNTLEYKRLDSWFSQHSLVSPSGLLKPNSRFPIVGHNHIPIPNPSSIHFRALVGWPHLLNWGNYPLRPSFLLEEKVPTHPWHYFYKSVLASETFHTPWSGYPRVSKGIKVKHRRHAGTQTHAFVLVPRREVEFLSRLESDMEVVWLSLEFATRIWSVWKTFHSACLPSDIIFFEYRRYPWLLVFLSFPFLDALLIWTRQTLGTLGSFSKSLHLEFSNLESLGIYISF